MTMEQPVSTTNDNVPVDFAHLYDTPLDDEHIRLVRLNPDCLHNSTSLREAQIHIQVGECRLSDIPPGELCALSYCWGSDRATKPIILNNKTVHVRTNIYDFLVCWRERIRAGKRPFYLWIDQFCIHQEDLSERAREVQRMDAIYKQASLVICWLGVGSKSSDEAMDMLWSIRNEPIVEFASDKIEGGGVERRDGESDDEDFDPDKPRQSATCPTEFDDDEASESDIPEHEERYLSGLRAICMLVALPYFRRMWCVQETALANQDALLLCGGREAPFEALFHLWVRQLNSGWIMFRQRYFPWDFEYTACNVDNFDWPRLFDYDAFWSGNPLKFLGIIVQSRNKQGPNGMVGARFLSLLIATQHYQCSEPVDKFYSLLKLANDADKLIPKVDYARRYEDVAIGFTRAWIQLYDRLDIIATVFRDAKDDREMPTWVAEWTHRPLHNTLISRWPHQTSVQDDIEHRPLYNTDGALGPAYRFWSNPGPSGTDCLLAVGLSCDVIDLLGEHYISAMSEEQGAAFPPTWRTTLERYMYQIKANLKQEDELWKRCFSVMLGGRRPDGSPFDRSQARVDITEERICFQLDRGDGLLCFETWMEPQWETIVAGRRFMITRDGQLGLVPWFAEEGDEIVTIFGCSVPLLIRRQQDGTCKIIGDCYADEMMRGEMIAAAGGPLVLEQKSAAILEEFDGLVKTDGKVDSNEVLTGTNKYGHLEPELFGIR